MQEPPLLQAVHIAKHFGALTALDDVSLNIHHGEVVALLGDNGAGKSTFIKVLSGVYAQSSGDLFIKGKRVNFSSPKEAAQAGIATIFQELALSTNLSIADNVFLGRELTWRILGLPFLKRSLMRERVDKLLKELDAHIADPRALVGNLSGGQRQAVAIARALNFNAELVIMDEPTAALAVAETRKVLNLIKKLAACGCGVVLISHNIVDVFEVAARLIVFRRGRKIAERRREATSPDEIIALITGVHPEVQAMEAKLHDAK